MLEIGDRVKYTGTRWELQGIANKHNKGWFDPAKDGGGDDQFLVQNPVINGPSSVYNNGDYYISNNHHRYDFTIGEAVTNGVDGEDVKMGDRVAYDGQNWVVIPASLGLMKGWMDPTQDGGGPWVPEVLVNGTPLYAPKDYVIAKWSGRYDFGSAKTDPDGSNFQAFDVKAGDRFYYNGIKWDKIIEDMDNTERIFAEYTKQNHGFAM